MRRARLVMLAVVAAVCMAAMCDPGLASRAASSVPGVAGMTMLAVGFAIGCYGTVVGIGGGPLLVPVLHFVYAWPTEDVVASSLFVVFLNALSGSFGYARQRRIDFKGGVVLSLAALPGAVLSGFIHHLFTVPSFDVIFGVFLLVLAAYTIAHVGTMDGATGRRRRRAPGLRRIVMMDAFRKKYDFYSDQNVGISVNLVLGFLSGFLGIGGGVLQVPVLVFLLGYPIHIATATSHFVTMLTSAFSLGPNVLLGNVHFGDVSGLAVGVVVGAQVGARIASKLRSKAILYLFCCILVAFALRLIFY